MKVYQVAMALSFAAPSLMMGIRLLHVWRDPMHIENGRWVQLGTGVFIMEFILLQVGIMLAAAGADAHSTAGKIASVAGLLAFYGLFAGAIALSFKSTMLLYSFLWMIGGRFLALTIGISESDQALVGAHSVVGMVIYFPLVVLSVFLPVPRFGITSEVAAATRMPGSSGAWVDHPHRAIGAATVYFLLLAVAEIAMMTWIDPRALTPR